MSLSLRNIITSIKGRSGLQINRVLRRSDMAVLWEAIKEKDVIISTGWSGDAEVQDSPRTSTSGAPDSGSESINNCSVAIDVTNFNTLVWKGTTRRGGTYGYGNAYIRGGSYVGGTNYFNILIRSHNYGDTNDAVSFDKTIDVSGITGNLYLSVYAFSAGGTDDENGLTAVGTIVDTTSITLFA